MKHGHANFGPKCAAKYFGRLVGGVRVKPERDEKTGDLFSNQENETRCVNSGTLTNVIN